MFRRYLLALALALVFLGSRIYRIDTSLLFFNDMGRDFLELYDWHTTGKPPLLGPQTSALSFNQSPFYYYLIYPFYLLTGGSAFASFVACTVWYLSWFIFGVISLRRHPKLLNSLLVVCWLITLHPEILRQTRFIWNPSFTPPLIIASLYSFWLIWESISQKNPHLPLVASWIFAFSLSLSCGLTYATVPLTLILLFWLIFKLRLAVWPLMFKFFLSCLIIFGPFIVFELRHHFTFTYLVFNGQRLAQTSVSLPQKLNDYARFFFDISPWIAVVITLLPLFWLLRRQKTFSFLWVIGVTLLVLFGFTLFGPVNLESHYIFALLCLLFFSFSLIPSKIKAIVLISLSLWWLKPSTIGKAYIPARRTVGQLQDCYQRFCATLSSRPLYVSMQSGLLPYHNAPEHRFLMKQSGCTVLDIESHQDQSDTMAVVVDDSTYVHGQTAYNELTLFGPSLDTGGFTCQENLSIHVLKKTSI